MVVILYIQVLLVNALFPDTFSFDITQPWVTVIYVHTKSHVH